MRITFAETSPGTVYKSLRDDVAFPYVTLADGPGYEEVHADGAPEGRGGVILIEPFDERLLSEWHELRRQRSTRRGYLGSRLLRGEPGYVAIVRWSSPLMHARAAREIDTPFTSQAALYLPA